jgi:hypothetical protein
MLGHLECVLRVALKFEVLTSAVEQLREFPPIGVDEPLAPLPHLIPEQSGSDNCSRNKDPLLSQLGKAFPRLVVEPSFAWCRA